MKKLQEKSEILSSSFPFQWVETLPRTTSKSYILLLHGLNERGLRIHRKLIEHLPDDAHIVAPNAPFPLPRFKSEKIDYGYTWYFFNKFTQTYDIDQSFAISLIKELIEKTNTENLPITIIGFSQGGYLAPVLAKEITNVEKVIGIGCEFRPIFFDYKMNYKLYALHGAEDDIIPSNMAKRCLNELAKKNIQVTWRELPETKHEINKIVSTAVREILDGK